MRRLTMVFAIALLVALGAIPVFAQSSGSFAYGTGNTGEGCVLRANGSFVGGVQCIVTSAGTCPLTATACATPGVVGVCSGIGAGSVCVASDACGSTGCCSTTACEFFQCTTDLQCQKIYGLNSGATCVSGLCKLPTSAGPGECMGNAQGELKTNSGTGNVFDVRISAVVGLITDVTVSSKQTQPAVSAALAGIDFTVAVTGENGTPNPTTVPENTVTFDARFVQISTNLFSALSGGCLSAVGGCFITFAESTVSAHSFEWVAGQPIHGAGALQSGEYKINASWAPSVGFGLFADSIGEAAACVGPVIVTASQNKIFKFNDINSLP